MSTLEHLKDNAQSEEDNVPLWLLTFADVMALMLTFFVLLYSMSSLDQGKWDKLSDAVNEGMNEFQAHAYQQGEITRIEIDRVDYRKALSTPYLETLLTDAVQRNSALKDMQLNPVHGNLVVSLPADTLFAPGGATLTADGLATLKTLSPYLNRIKNRIEVVGHADPTPIGSSNTYQSNRALSLARAVFTAKALRDSGYERNIGTKGLSSSRFFTLPDMEAIEDKNALARRVDIVILKNDGVIRKSITLK